MFRTSHSYLWSSPEYAHPPKPATIRLTEPSARKCTEVWPIHLEVKVLTLSGPVVLEVIILDDDDEQLEPEGYDYYAFREEIDLEWDRIHCVVRIKLFTT